MPRKKISSKNPAKIPANKALMSFEIDSAKDNRKNGSKTSPMAMRHTTSVVETKLKIHPSDNRHVALPKPGRSNGFSLGGKMNLRATMNPMMPATMKARLKTRGNGTRSPISDGHLR